MSTLLATSSTGPKRKCLPRFPASLQSSRPTSCRQLKARLRPHNTRASWVSGSDFVSLIRSLTNPDHHRGYPLASRAQRGHRVYPPALGNYTRGLVGVVAEEQDALRRHGSEDDELRLDFMFPVVFSDHGFISPHTLSIVSSGFGVDVPNGISFPLSISRACGHSRASPESWRPFKPHSTPTKGNVIDLAQLWP